MTDLPVTDHDPTTCPLRTVISGTDGGWARGCAHTGKPCDPCHFCPSRVTRARAGLTPHHDTFYGQWAGNPRGRKADPARCAQSVYSGGSRLSSQCSRANGHGPDGAYCAQHDPVRRAAKAAEQRAALEAKWAEQDRRNRLRDLASEMRDALRAIADGHNDPRSLAQEVLAKLED